MAWTREEIDDRLSRQLEPVLSSRRTTAQVTEVVCSLHPAQQERVLTLFDVAVASNEEIGYQFLLNVPEAIVKRGPHGLHGWLLEALDRYDQGGMYPAVQFLNEIHREQRLAGAQSHQAVRLDDVARVLETYVNGLSRRRLAVDVGEVAFTDGETLFLPNQVAVFPAAEDNFRLYKVMVTLQWAQLAQATFRLRLAEVGWPAADGVEAVDDLGGLEAFLTLFPDPQLANRLFLLAEGIRLEAWLGGELPGLARVLGEVKQSLARARPAVGGLAPRAAFFDALSRWYLRGSAPGTDGDGSGVAEAAAARLATLRTAGATVETSAAVVAALYPSVANLAGGGEASLTVPYLGELRPAQVAATLRRLRAGEAHAFRTAVAHLVGERPADIAQGEIELRPKQDGHPPRRERAGEPPAEDLVFQLWVDGRSLEIPGEVQSLVHTILDDLGEIPPEYLVAGGNAPGYAMAERGEEPLGHGAAEPGGYVYDEWDYRRGSYRKRWCVVQERPTAASAEPAVERALAKHAGVVTTLRRQFEMLRTEERWLRRQRYGTDIDLDAVVEAVADARAGIEPDDRLFSRVQRAERNIAVAFLVDMSGSTKGWINQAQKESLALLCEALEVLGDRYAIFGFSGMTRLRCEFFTIKQFDQPYDDGVRMRIAGIEPQDYTRLGAAIRHTTRLLAEVEARTRLLITLSDGKPDDWDHYRGATGIEDTRRALIEAKRQEIHPFCITIDREAHDYIAHMYGAVNYCLVEDVRTLPRKIPEVYRRLTR
ncbi:MAG TPA: VWA domain-containing protein [bacterium]|jgi:nitric oxide reductase NorD protein